MISALKFAGQTDKYLVFAFVKTFLDNEGFKVASEDHHRPWGGFFVIDESQSARFIEAFFPHLKPADFSGFKKLSPKILIVAPGKRLSWQYHHRRSEIWRVIGGSAAISTSPTDEETPARNLKLGEVVSLSQGERHRLIGTEEFGVIAEIWKHTDASNPSDEDDIVRVQDEFGRGK
jgi:mannose-6-phosphate isomerase-like protein (cupin superfamily)